MTRHSLRIGAALLAGALVLSGCGQDSEPTPSAADLTAAELTAAREAEEARSESTAQAKIQARYDRLATPVGGVVEIDGEDGSLTPAAVSRYGREDATSIRQRTQGADLAFSELCSGEVDLVDSARPITRAEWDSCRANGLDVVQFQIAADAVVLAIKSQTDVGGDCLSTDQVRETFRAGSPVTGWADLGLADLPLTPGGPDLENGAFSLFGDIVLDSTNVSITSFRSDYRAWPQDQDALTWVAGDPATALRAASLPDVSRRFDQLQSDLVAAGQVYADADAEVQEALDQRAKGIRDGRPVADLERDQQRVDDAYAARALTIDARDAVQFGLDELRPRFQATQRAAKEFDALAGNIAYFRFSYYDVHEELLRPFEVTDSSGDLDCVFPSQSTITTGQYPLSRPLLMTSTTRSLERREVHDFLDAYLSAAPDLAADANLVQVPLATLDEQRAWLDAPDARVLVAPEAQRETSRAPVEVPAR